MVVQHSDGAPEGGLGRLLSVPTDLIVPNPRQPRRTFSAEQIEALAASIGSQGVIQPLVVRPHPERAGHFELVAGERRLRALRHLGRASVPVLVRDVPDTSLLETALVENLQREPLTPIEEAHAYRALLLQHGYTQEALAARVGRQRSTIANMVRLLSLPPAVQEDLEAGRLTVGHARALLALPHADRQLGVRTLVLERGLSVRETERLINRELGRGTGDAPGSVASEHGAGVALPPPGLPTSRAEQLSFSFHQAQEALEQALATRVAVEVEPPRSGGAAPGDGQTQGAIRIEFYSLEEFNRLYDLLRSG